MAEEKIVVTGSSLPNVSKRTLQQVCIAVGSFLVGRGWLSADTASALGAVALVLLPALWQQIGGWVSHREKVDLAEDASIGTVK